MTPSDRKYTKSHEWVKVEGEGAVVGITDHAQAALGDITFMDFPAVGKVVEQGGECGVIESVKAASDIYAPIGGTVAEANAAINTDPAIVNKDPYGKGWLVKLKGIKADDLATLMDAAAYDASRK